jgi:hypothetical protein
VTAAPHDPAPMIAALCLWIIGPAVFAAIRLSRSAIG